MALQPLLPSPAEHVEKLRAPRERLGSLQELLEYMVDTRAEPLWAPPGPLRDPEEKLALRHLEAITSAARTQVTDLQGWQPPDAEAQLLTQVYISAPVGVGLCKTKCFLLVKLIPLSMIPPR